MQPPTLTSPDLSHILESLYALQRHGIKLGLEHTHRLLEFLGDPHKDLTLIHIAGTNGKGSTCAYIDSILRADGKKIGLYTSPHLIRFNERIRVNGLPIEDYEIIAFMEHAGTTIKEIESTFFETTTAMALDHFKRHSVDVAVIETGLGGRLDSTNVIKPDLIVITSISMDHMDILGNTIEKIAEEKAGIIKDNIPVISVDHSKTIQKILCRKAQEKNTSITIAKSPSDIRMRVDCTEFCYDGTYYRTSLVGEHQAANAALAIAATQRYNPLLNNEMIETGLNTLCWPGRMQKLSDRIYYDVAHNEDGIKMAFKSVHALFPNKPFYGLFCLKGEKELDRIGKYISGKFDRLLVSSDKKGLLLDTHQLSTKLTLLGIHNEPVESIIVGIKKIKQIIRGSGVALIFGTHYIAEEIFLEFEISFDTGVI
ncbi:MAG TPA: Mur ligase family protein [Candidatus Marinimicrobia bacterium]|nr:Mur ligase family protein [Candidatus Neomarinimicrobiota bacterium]